VDAFPDLATLSIDELKKLISELEEEENEISYRRRLLHGKIDILRAELVARQKGGEGALRRHDRPSEILPARHVRRRGRRRRFLRALHITGAVPNPRG
jgi:hypothetical protein